MPKLSNKPIIPVCKGVVSSDLMHHTLLGLFCVAAEGTVIATLQFVMSWGTHILVQIIAVHIRIVLTILMYKEVQEMLSFILNTV